MADENKTLSKEEAAAAKAAAKAAEKERKERIKRNKPKEPKPNIFVRILNAIKKFFKDFRGTCKKVIWPDGKTVLKSSIVVLVCTLIVGIGVWLVDWGLSAAVKILDGIEDIAIHAFTERDVVRHRLGQKIIKAYEKYDREQARRETEKAQKRYRVAKKPPETAEKRGR